MTESPTNGSSVVLRPAELQPVERGGGARTIYLVGPSVGAQGFMNGITSFDVGAGIPLHSHNCEESVMVLEGEAWFDDESVRHELGPGDTTLVPAGVVHRFVNRGDRLMRIFWTYGSSSPTRTLAETGETRPVAHEGVAG